MIIGSWGRRRLIQALYEAIEYRESLIDAHRTTWAKNRRKGQPYKVIGPEHRSCVRRWRCDIKVWKRLIRELERKGPII